MQKEKPFIKIVVRTKRDISLVSLLLNPRQSLMDTLMQVSDELFFLKPVLHFQAGDRRFVFSHYEVLCAPEAKDAVFIRLWFVGSPMVAPVPIAIHIDSEFEVMVMSVEKETPLRKRVFDSFIRRLTDKDAVSSCPILSSLAFSYISSRSVL